MPKFERAAYINAVYCLANHTATTPLTLVYSPGTGGGCISGPFGPATRWAANIYPRGLPVRGSGDGWRYNSRYITRD
jgi:hypothetical protein